MQEQPHAGGLFLYSHPFELQNTRAWSTCIEWKATTLSQARCYQGKLLADSIISGT